ncbi:hypothetical protein Q8F55_005367 [Vanrija albida]|uniref:Uncharacterized protein n=1 Tax=Vanrija albida TaxID=181172 RepID=A0ABR3Q1F4_9TREE
MARTTGTTSRVGFTWVLADLSYRTEGLYASQARFQQPTDVAWRDARLTRVNGV